MDKAALCGNQKFFLLATEMVGQHTGSPSTAGKKAGEK
jgi:hypothetical protein